MPPHLSSVAVYCGSSPGADPGFAAAAGSLGRLLAASEIAWCTAAGRWG